MMSDLGEKNANLLKNVTMRKNKKSRLKGVTGVATHSTYSSSPPVQVDDNIREGYVEPVPHVANARINVPTCGLANPNEVTNTHL